MTALTADGHSLARFGGDPRRSSELVAELGFEPVANPVDLLGRGVSGLREFFEVRADRFGVSELYRVGARTAQPGTVGVYVAVLAAWGLRSSDRDRARRRIARALVERGTDSRALVFLVPNEAERSAHAEAELVFPRPVQGGSGAGTLTTVRALIDVSAPNRFHRDLFSELTALPGASLASISQQWQRVFSVERVAKAFYQEYQLVREALADALLPANPQHEVVSTLTADERRAWATRQLGRVLFLWFLQSKRWLGGDGSQEGRADYLVDLWRRRSKAEGGFYRGMLLPLFFEGMARRNPGRPVRELLEYTPYLNGGLFRRNALEDRIKVGGEVGLPDELFDPARDLSVLGLLSRYRFTTRESTPDDQSVDPDPELLGRVFENLYQGDERHDTGTFYTPREIVHFMCCQALDGYLRDTAAIDQETIDRLRREVTDPEETDGPLDPEVERRLVEALESVRVCDPAVGSGAFLLGTMQEIVRLRQGVLHAKGHEGQSGPDHVAEWKRHAIQWSLYGVDINPEAVEICQLRLWLSLVLDIQSRRDIDPLPNLDFRIVAGDSLIDRAVGIPFAESLPQGVYQPPMEIWKRVKHEEEQIDKWRREFEGTQENPERLKELRENIVRASQRVVRLHLTAELDLVREAAEGAEKRASQPVRTPSEKKRLLREATAKRARQALVEAAIAGLNPDAPYQKPFLWPVAFPEVFHHGGFDVVLANPPYVRMERLDNEDERTYGAAFPEVAAPRADILVYFYSRALQLLREGGWLAFITSNKYMRAAYGAGARAHLPASVTLSRIIDLGDLPLFDSNGKGVAAYPAVVVGRRGAPATQHVLRVVDLASPVRHALLESGRAPNSEHVREVLGDLDVLLAQHEVIDYPQILLRREGWILEEPSLVRLFDRLMSKGKRLIELADGKIYMGAKTGLNEAFVIDKTTRDELVAADPRSADLIKPWLRGRDIRRWRPEWAGLYVIFANRGVAIDRYPAVRRHLEQFRDKLERRATAHTHPWYELQQPQEGIYREFEKAKAVWPDIADGVRFAWDESGAYPDMTAFMSATLPKHVVALLNSTPAEFLIRMLTASIRGGFVRLKTAYIGPLMLPEVSGSLRIDLERALSAESSAQGSTSTIDELASAAFGLTSSETQDVAAWLQRRSRSRADNTGEDVDSPPEEIDDE